MLFLRNEISKTFEDLFTVTLSTKMTPPSDSMEVETYLVLDFLEEM